MIDVKLMGKVVHCCDDPDGQNGIVCGHNNTHYIIGFENDYGCILSFNPIKCVLIEPQLFKTFRFARASKITVL